MSVGNDGFTDCSYVCNPENSMQWSCNEYCAGYEFRTPTSPAVVPSAVDIVNGGTNEDAFLYWVVYLCIGVILFALIVIVICCLNKQRIHICVQKCWDKRLPNPTQVQTQTTVEDAESGARETGEDGATSPLVLSGNTNGDNQTSDPPGDFRDSGVSVGSASVPNVNDGLDGQIAIDVGNSVTGSYNRPEGDETRTQGNADRVTYQFVTEGDTIPKKFEEHACLAIGQTGQSMPFSGSNMLLHT